MKFPDKKLSLYSAAASAFVASSTANATIVYSGSQNAVLTPVSGSTVMFDLDLDSNAVVDFTIELSATTNPTSTVFYRRIGRMVNNGNPANALLAETGSEALPFLKKNDANYTVSAARPFTTSQTWMSIPIPGKRIAYGSFTGSSFAGGAFLGASGFVSIRFDISGSTHYGWMQMSTASDMSNITIYDWAYEDVAGQSIQTGQIPEPAATGAGLGLLALGVAGIRRMRAKKAA